jgi:hypothetical protein
MKMFFPLAADFPTSRRAPMKTNASSGMWTAPTSGFE